MAKSPCAYCKAHKKYLTVKQLKLHNCTKRCCEHLQHVNHPYWDIKEQHKLLSAERRKFIYGTATDIKPSAEN